MIINTSYIKPFIRYSFGERFLKIVFDNAIKPKLPALKKYVEKKIGVRCPRQFIIVDEIPRNTSGKISRDKGVELSCKRRRFYEKADNTYKFYNTVSQPDQASNGPERRAQI